MTDPHQILTYPMPAKFSRVQAWVNEILAHGSKSDRYQQTMNSLAENVQVLQGRDLTEDEKNSLIKFQEIYEIGDDDPLVVVLALMGANKILLESAPELLFKKAIEAIELHQQTLKAQSTLIAKELILTLSHQVLVASNELVSRKDRMTKHVLMFFAGGLTCLGAVLICRLLGYV